MSELALSEAELSRLSKRHSDIVRLGSGALEAQREREALQERRRAWVALHGLSCFKCGGTLRDWAAGGVKFGRRWVVCVDCVRRPR